MSASNAVPLPGNDETTSFKQYFGESLMEAWYRMQEIIASCPNTNTQKKWSKPFLDALTIGYFTTDNPSFSTLVLVSLFENAGIRKKKLNFNN